jgi:SAM-dependent methyltransferase
VSAREARYDAIAEWYPGFAAAFGEGDAPFPPGFLGDVDGLRVLDVACGQGRTSRTLAGRGASVTAIDLSARLIELAQAEESETPDGIVYAVADAAGLTDLDASSFDLVVCNMGLSDIDDLAGLARNVAAWLRPGGAFAAVIIHPCFPGTAERPPSWPPAGYFEEGWWNSGLENGGIRARIGANHRTVSTYLNTFTEAGLAIDRIEEPVWLPGLPGFLAIRCVRT